MSKERDEELFNIEPEFFVRNDMRASAMCFGFEIGDGWTTLVRQLLLMAKNKKDNPRSIPNEDPKATQKWRDSYPCVPDTEEAWKENPDRVERKEYPISRFNDEPIIRYYHKCERPWNHFQVMQVKEKYGGLRFYTQGGTEDFEGAIHFAEQLSYIMCERCGAPAKQWVTGGWVSTACDEHKREGAVEETE